MGQGELAGENAGQGRGVSSEATGGEVHRAGRGCRSSQPGQMGKGMNEAGAGGGVAGKWGAALGGGWEGQAVMLEDHQLAPGHLFALRPESEWMA